MGTFHRSIRIAKAGGSEFIELRALVDSGAAYSWVPGSILKRIGAEPKVRRKFTIADGSVLERDVAEVSFRIDSETLTTFAIFGDEGSEPLLGALTLEQFALGVDPVNRRLIPVTLPEAST